MADFSIKQGDLGPKLTATLTKSDGTAQDLTGGTVKFSMEFLNGQLKVNDQTCTVVSAAAGTVEYAWQTGNTDTPGLFRGEFHVTGLSPTPVTFPSGKSATHPTGYLEIEVLPKVS